MKVLKVSRGQDYVRFSLNVELEVSPGLVVKSDVYGDFTKVPSLYGDITRIEDPELNNEYFLFGKKTKYVEFQKMYNDLFCEEFNSFVERTDKVILKATYGSFENTIDTFSKRAQVEIINEAWVNVDRVTDTQGKVWIKSNKKAWTLISHLQDGFPKAQLQRKRKEAAIDGCYYFYENQVVKELIRSL